MMKLDIRRVVVASSRNVGRYIRFSSNGQIAVSAEAVRILEISEEDKAVFFQDNNNAKDWYFSFGKQGDYPLRKTGKEHDDTLQFSSSGIRAEVANALELPKKTFRLWVSKEPVNLEDKKLWKLNLREP